MLINLANPWRIQFLFPNKQATQGIALADLNDNGTINVLTNNDIKNDRYIEAWNNNGVVSRDGLKFSPVIDLPIESFHPFDVGNINGDGHADIIIGRQNKINQVYLSQLDLITVVLVFVLWTWLEISVYSTWLTLIIP